MYKYDKKNNHTYPGYTIKITFRPILQQLRVRFTGYVPFVTVLSRRSIISYATGGEAGSPGEAAQVAVDIVEGQEPAIVCIDCPILSKLIHHPVFIGRMSRFILEHPAEMLWVFEP